MCAIKYSLCLDLDSVLPDWGDAKFCIDSYRRRMRQFKFCEVKADSLWVKHQGQPRHQEPPLTSSSGIFGVLLCLNELSTDYTTIKYVFFFFLFWRKSWKSNFHALRNL